MNSIAFGQYYPARSFLHRLDGRVKILLAIVYIVSTFLAKNIWSFAALLASAVLLLLVSRIPPRIVLRSLRPILFLMLFTAIINVFWTRGETEPLWSFWKIRIYMEGLYGAGFMLVRIIALILCTSLFLTYTTTPIELTDAMESLLSPLRIFRVPVHEFAMMMTIALRFIPTLMEETSKIMNAQKARGVNFSEGGLIRRAKALIPILVPLIVSSFRRADELAMAMECRCYRGGKGRTKFHTPHLHFCDFAAFLLMAAFCAGIVLLNLYANGYTL